jgi:hypothetical protein
LSSDDSFAHWFGALEGRHLANLRFSEVRKAVQALSSLYVERREHIDKSTVFEGAGKRAAFAMYFAPLHFLLVREIVRALGARVPGNKLLLDLGCGTGIAGAAWTLECDPQPRVVGLDRNRWALEECRWNYKQLGVSGIAKTTDVATMRIPADAAVIAAFTINELDPSSRGRLHGDLIRQADRGAPVLIIEPIARRMNAWWDDWAQQWKARGGREDEWRFPAKMPERLALMDKAAGLDHRELTGRSLWLPASAW